MKIKDYTKVRKIGKELTEKVIKKANKNRMHFFAKKFNFWNDEQQVIVFEDEFDTQVYMDYLIYGKGKKGDIVLDDFYESDIELSDEEEDFLDGMINYKASLFKVKKVDELNAIITLEDVLDKNSVEYPLMDIGLSQTAAPNVLFYTRLLPLNNVFITSGVSFAFEEQHQLKIINDIKSFQFKKRRQLNNDDLFLLCFKKSKVYGRNVSTMDVE